MKDEEVLEMENGDERRPRAVSDLVRKALVSGAGALFMTEEGIRSVVKELKLPKDALSSALAQAEKTKAELTRIVGAEVNAFLRSAQVREELVEVLSKLRLEIRAEVSFHPKEKEEEKGGKKRKKAVESKVSVRTKSAGPASSQKASGEEA